MMLDGSEVARSRLDATIEWMRHKTYCVDPCDRIWYEVSLAGLLELRRRILMESAENVERSTIKAS